MGLRIGLGVRGRDRVRVGACLHDDLGDLGEVADGDGGEEMVLDLVRVRVRGRVRVKALGLGLRR